MKEMRAAALALARLTGLYLLSKRGVVLDVPQLASSLQATDYEALQRELLQALSELGYPGASFREYDPDIDPPCRHVFYLPRTTATAQPVLRVRDAFYYWGGDGRVRLQLPKHIQESCDAQVLLLPSSSSSTSQEKPLLHRLHTKGLSQALHAQWGLLERPLPRPQLKAALAEAAVELLPQLLPQESPQVAFLKVILLALVRLSVSGPAYAGLRERRPPEDAAPLLLPLRGEVEAVQLHPRQLRQYVKRLAFAKSGSLLQQAAAELLGPGWKDSPLYHTLWLRAEAGSHLYAPLLQGLLPESLDDLQALQWLDGNGRLRSVCRHPTSGLWKGARSDSQQLQHMKTKGRGDVSLLLQQRIGANGGSKRRAPETTTEKKEKEEEAKKQKLPTELAKTLDVLKKMDVDEKDIDNLREQLQKVFLQKDQALDKVKQENQTLEAEKKFYKDKIIAQKEEFADTLKRQADVTKQMSFSSKAQHQQQEKVIKDLNTKLKEVRQQQEQKGPKKQKTLATGQLKEEKQKQKQIEDLTAKVMKAEQEQQQFQKVRQLQKEVTIRFLASPQNPLLRELRKVVWFRYWRTPVGPSSLEALVKNVLAAKSQPLTWDEGFISRLESKFNMSSSTLQDFFEITRDLGLDLLYPNSKWPDKSSYQPRWQDVSKELSFLLTLKISDREQLEQIVKNYSDVVHNWRRSTQSKISRLVKYIPVVADKWQKATWERADFQDAKLVLLALTYGQLLSGLSLDLERAEVQATQEIQAVLVRLVNKYMSLPQKE